MKTPNMSDYKTKKISINNTKKKLGNSKVILVTGKIIIHKISVKIFNFSSN